MTYTWTEAHTNTFVLFYPDLPRQWDWYQDLESHRESGMSMGRHTVNMRGTIHRLNKKEKQHTLYVPCMWTWWPTYTRHRLSCLPGHGRPNAPTVKQNNSFFLHDVSSIFCHKNNKLTNAEHWNQDPLFGVMNLTLCLINI